MDTSLLLAGLRVLVVEDNFIVAESMKFALENFGCTVVGPAPTPELALELANQVAIDAAVLDIELKGKTSFSVARRLVSEGRPIVFLTGYDGQSIIPPDLASQPCVSKPVDPQRLARLLAEQVERCDGAAGA